MSATDPAALRKQLRELLRIARFEAWALDQIEDAIDRLYRRGVTIQPPPPADQPLGPP